MIPWHVVIHVDRLALDPVYFQILKVCCQLRT
jgi:hypothetical protein